MNELADRIMAMEQYCQQVQDLDKSTVSIAIKGVLLYFFTFWSLVSV